MNSDVDWSVQAKQFQHRLRTLAGFAPRQALAPLQDDFQLLAGSQGGEQIVSLKDEADVPLPEALPFALVHSPQVVAQGEDLPAVGLQQS